MVVRRFLDSTWSQLTYHGLFNLASLLEPGALVALFRSSHLSVLYKPEGEESALYTLVTDHVFLQEPSVVWERLEDVDGGSSTFVDSDFIHAHPVGGDFAGQTAEGALAAFDAETGQFAVIDPAEYVSSILPNIFLVHIAHRQSGIGATAASRRRCTCSTGLCPTGARARGASTETARGEPPRAEGAFIQG